MEQAEMTTDGDKEKGHRMSNATGWTAKCTRNCTLARMPNTCTHKSGGNKRAEAFAKDQPKKLCDARMDASRKHGREQVGTWKQEIGN
eukprot:scaffold197178_cov13-Tisochrysis_lutea.AAC.1